MKTNVEYWYDSGYQFIYKIVENDIGLIRSINGKEDKRDYREQNDYIKYNKQCYKITKKEANDICRKWHKKNPFIFSDARKVIYDI